MTNEEAIEIIKAYKDRLTSSGMKISDLICPLIKEPCIRDKCVCFSIRNYDFIGCVCEPYAVCEYFQLSLDSEAKGGAE